jgi:hypothetical protein
MLNPSKEKEKKMSKVKEKSLETSEKERKV